MNALPDQQFDAVFPHGAIIAFFPSPQSGKPSPVCMADGEDRYLYVAADRICLQEACEEIGVAPMEYHVHDYAGLVKIERIVAERNVVLAHVTETEIRPFWLEIEHVAAPNARPMHPDWARSLLGQCQAAGVPFFFKQWGEWGDYDSIHATGLAHEGWYEPDSNDGGVPCHEWPGPVLNGVELRANRPSVYRVGKARAGRLLGGREWNDFPEAA